VFIDPRSPWQNAWIESFNARLRDEYLNSQLFDSLLEAKVLLGDWRIDYNNSHSGWFNYRDLARMVTIWRQPKSCLVLRVCPCSVDTGHR